MSDPLNIRSSIGNRFAILLADDDEILRDMLTTCLEHAGYVVMAAPDAYTALRLLSTAKEQVLLLVTDIDMPGMSGLELAERVSALANPCGVLLLSGGAAPADGEAKGWEFLPKPFSLNLFLQTTAGMLSGAKKIRQKGRRARRTSSKDPACGVRSSLRAK
jgi:CheY-like chemotaxis protein